MCQILVCIKNKVYTYDYTYILTYILIIIHTHTHTLLSGYKNLLFRVHGKKYTCFFTKDHSTLNNFLDEKYT